MNSQPWVSRRSGPITTWLAVLLCCGVGVLAWSGYRAADEWRRNSEKLVASREIEIGRTLRINLGPDMRAVEAAMLSSPDWEAVPLQPPEKIAARLARTFARYPYPEVFFLWHVESPVVFFTRRDRMPGWLSSAGTNAPFPVVTTEGPATSGANLSRIGRHDQGTETELRKRLATDLTSTSEYSIFETRIHDLR